jgi:serine/threonine protein kinase
VDSSLPVLVSRLPDRRSLTRLVRAALRHEVAQVELAYGPQTSHAHTLDVQIGGQSSLALLAEPVGAPRNGHFPLRLRPLHRAQAAQLYALLEGENAPIDVPPDTSPTDTSPENVAPPPDADGIVDRTLALDPSNVGGAFDASPLVRGMSAAATPAKPRIDLSRTMPLAQDPRRMMPSAPSANIDPRKTAPSAAWRAEPPGAFRTTAVYGSPPSSPQPAAAATIPDDPRRTKPSAEWAAIRSAAAMFEKDASTALPLRGTPVDAAPLSRTSTDVHALASEADEPNHTVALEFRPDAALMASIPSPLGDESSPPAVTPPLFGAGPPAEVPSMMVEEVAVEEPASDEPGAFFDAALADLPAAPLTEDPIAAAVPSSSSTDDVDEGWVDVPPPPENDEADATIIRMPVSLAPSTPAEEPPLPQKTSTGRKLKLKEEEATAVTELPPHHARRSSLPPAEDPALGRRIADGKYVIESLIGSGATGAVYRATHRELRRTVAIKILHPHYQQDPQFMSGFRDEALAASQLDHPNVMRVLDFDQEPDGLIYIVMEYLSGRTLQSLLDEERRISTERAVEIMIQVCAALSIAHDNGIIHRDIKPDNIMLVPSRNDEGTTFELVKVCDFGIAALKNTRTEDADPRSVDSVITGTPEYMSPEQAQGADVDARSDVYACGICLYELVTGRPPFLGEQPADILQKQLQEPPRPPSLLIKGLDPIMEEIILRAIQKPPSKRHQSARELRVELKELIEPGGDGASSSDRDERSIIESVPVLDDPGSGFTGFFMAFASALLRIGRFERGHHETAQAMKDLAKTLHVALRGRSELTFARRDVPQGISFVVMTGTAEIVDLRRLLGSQVYGSFGQPFVELLASKGIVSLTIRERLADAELSAFIELLLVPLAGEELRQALLAKPLRHFSVLFVADVVGRDRMLSWKVGLGASRLARDLRALCNVRGISLKKMRETRDELIGGVARLLTRGDEVKQFILNSDLVDDAVANLRGFSSFEVAPVVIDRVLHEPCAEAAMILLGDYEAAGPDEERIHGILPLFARRLVTERSAASDAAVAVLYRRKFITDNDVPRDLKESIRAQTLADGLAREPSQFLLMLDLIVEPEMYAHELTTLEAAMAALARRGEAIALLAVMSVLARHARGNGKAAGPRENAALRTMKSMLDKQRLLPIAQTVLAGPPHQREAARQLVVLAGSVGAAALHAARETMGDPNARAIFVQVLRETGPAGWALLSQVLPQVEVRDDAELAIVEDLLRAIPDRADPTLGEAVSKFLAHPLLRPVALVALASLWGDRAKKPLVEALEYAEEPTRVVALGELRRLRGIDDYVLSVLERFLTMRGSAGEELRSAAAAALVDVAHPLRARAVQLLAKAVEGKRGLVALLRGSDHNDENVVVLEAMGRALLTIDRAEGLRAIKARLSRSDAPTRARLTALLQNG